MNKSEYSLIEITRNEKRLSAEILVRGNNYYFSSTKDMITQTEPLNQKEWDNFYNNRIQEITFTDAKELFKTLWMEWRVTV